MIKEIDINGFSTELKNTKLDYPQSSNGNAFKFFFNYLGVASRGRHGLHSPLMNEKPVTSSGISELATSVIFFSILELIPL
jgi:hypothetical protein